MIKYSFSFLENMEQYLHALKNVFQNKHLISVKCFIEYYLHVEKIK